MGEINEKVLTPKQARRAVRSLAYRRRLKPAIPKLESKLKTYLLSGE